MKYFAPFNNVNNSSISGRGISAKTPFLVPVAGVIACSREFNFLYSMHKWSCYNGACPLGHTFADDSCI